MLMLTKRELNEFRFEATARVHLKAQDMPNGGNYTIRNTDGSYMISISDSVLSKGHQFTNMVVAVVGMPKGPWDWSSVRRFQMSRDGQEGSFFYQNHLIRWYIDFHHDNETPSLYVTLSRYSSWWNRVQYCLRNTQQLKEVRRKKHASYA